MKTTSFKTLGLFLAAISLVSLLNAGCAKPTVVRRSTVSQPTPATPPPQSPLPPSGTATEAPSPPAQSAPSAPQEPRIQSPKEPTPRMVASLRMTEEARLLLEEGKTDQAIRTLERALNLNPSNGQNFYYLSEAWLKKKNPRQAEEFNRLAAIYLKNDERWMARVSEQAERIKRSKQ